MSTTTTTPITIETIQTATVALGQHTGRALRRVRDAELPVTREEADQFLRANTDALNLLWSLLRTASGVVDDYDRALTAGRDVYQAGAAHRGEIQQRLDTLDITDYTAFTTRERLTAEAETFRTALDALAREIDTASDPHRLFVEYVGRAIETALLLDRDVKLRRLRDALEEMRRRLDSIRHSAAEHVALQETWERRLGRRFSLPEVKE
jgi:hypothetical protein